MECQQVCPITLTFAGAAEPKVCAAMPNHSFEQAGRPAAQLQR